MTAATAPKLGAGQGSIPRHVAIIMDGNGRWAKKRMLPRLAGHKKGVDAVKSIVRAAGDLGIDVLTLYAFSTENWRRPEEEVSDLMGLLKQFIIRDLAEIARNGVRLRVIGDYQALKPDLVALIDDAIEKTALNTAMTLVIALNYGAQAEIARAARSLAEDVSQGKIALEEVGEEAIEARLYTHGLPPVDLLIRTSGEERLSNFLLWQVSYAEFHFTQILWPDFDAKALKAAIDRFAERDRRYGGL